MKSFNCYRDSRDKICSFPTYMHAVIDLNWALDLLEKDADENVSIETLDELKIYASNCDTFVVKVPMYVD